MMTALIAAATFTSCVYIEIVPDEDILNQEQNDTTGETTEEEEEKEDVPKQLKIQVTNDEQYLSLTVHGVELMNTTPFGDRPTGVVLDSPVTLEKGDTCEVLTTLIAKDAYPSWDRTSNPLRQKGTYAVISCIVMQDQYPLLCGDSAGKPAPAYASIRIDETDGQTLVLALDSRDTWKVFVGGSLRNLLNPIEIDPTTNTWKE